MAGSVGTHWENGCVRRTRSLDRKAPNCSAGFTALEEQRQKGGLARKRKVSPGSPHRALEASQGVRAQDRYWSGFQTTSPRHLGPETSVCLSFILLLGQNTAQKHTRGGEGLFHLTGYNPSVREVTTGEIRNLVQKPGAEATGEHCMLA